MSRLWDKLHSVARSFSVAELVTLVFAALYYYVVLVRLPAVPSVITIAPAILLLVMLRARGGLRYWLAFFSLFLFYEAFRSLADDINGRVHFAEVVRLEMWVFGGYLPNLLLQGLRREWLDWVFFAVYATHFVNVLVPAVYVWRRHPQRFAFFVSCILITVYLGFVVFLLFPVAPPRMLAWIPGGGLAEVRPLMTWITASIAVPGWPSVLRSLNANPYAAMPSMHFALPFAVFLIMRGIDRRFAIGYAILSALIGVGAVYLGEHYALDVLGGGLAAYLGYWATGWWMQRQRRAVLQREARGW